MGAEAGLVAKTFSTYPGYAGSLTSVQGVVVVGQSAAEDVILWYDFKGGDPECQGDDNGETNTCGIHIHKGSACNAADGHYWVGGQNDDPWGEVQYKQSSGKFIDTNLVVKAGTTQAQNKGKSLVLHDSNGTRIACGILAEDMQTASTTTGVVGAFSKYSEYNGSLAVSGNVKLMQTANARSDGDATPALFMEYSLENVDTQCLTTAIRAAGNACGIHVHVGSCTSDEEVAGHYWDEQKVTEDPWEQVVYFSDGDGKTGATISVQIGTGKAVESMLSVVVHDMTGARVACADVGAMEPQKSLITSGAAALDMRGIFAGAVLTVFAGLARAA